MQMLIRGRELPGRAFGAYDNVHVALQVRADPVEPVRGDAVSASWVAEVQTVDGDFRGPAVHGKRDGRFLYLTWGSPSDGDWGMFRRAKLMLGDISSELVAAAGDQRLVAEVSLTDERGGPRCGRVVPPSISWSIG